MSYCKLRNQFDFFEEEFKKYEQILEEYKKDNSKVFVDKNFHPTDDNNIDNLDLFTDDEKINGVRIKWKRIDEVYPAPLFRKNKIHQDYINQGRLGDCYFITALSRIAKNGELVQSLFNTQLPDKILGKITDSINIKCGAVVVYFHVFGRRTPVLIDTRIPFIGSVPCFSYPIDNRRSAWFCLVEKAFAKLNGSYINIKGGHFSESFYSLFGYYNKYFYCTADTTKNVFKIFRYQQRGYLMDAGIARDVKLKDVLKKVNLIDGHSYLIVKVRKYKDKVFFQLRNPWGFDVWTGDYSINSDLWKNDPDLQAFLKEEPKNGSFWITDKDFFTYYNEFEVSKPIHPLWTTRIFSFQPFPSQDAGHLHLYDYPNFIFKLRDELKPGEKARVRIFVEKRNKEYEKLRLDNNNFYIYACKNGGKRMTTYDSKRDFCVCALHCNTLSIKVLSKDDIVTFTIVHEAPLDVEADCYVSVFCEHDFDLYDIDKPGNIFMKSSEEHSAYFDNFTKSDPYIAYVLKPINGNGNGNALWPMNATASNFGEEGIKKKEKLTNLVIKNLFEKTTKQITSGVQINCNNYIFNNELIGRDDKSNIYLILDKETIEDRAAFISRSPIDEALQNFTEKLSIMMELKYPSIINYIGFSESNFSKKPYPMIITDVYKRGTLYDALEDHLSELTTTKKMIILIGIAFAMNYIHKHNIILHYLRCSSIMLDDNLHPIIADFNAAKKCHGNSITHDDEDFLKSVPSYCWAPEFISGSEPYSYPIDVFAYGMLFYHVISNEEPTIINNGKMDLFNKIYHNELPSLNEIPGKHHKFIESMWNKDPRKRPTFEQIIDKLLHSQYECWLENVDDDEIELYIHQFGETLKPKNRSEYIKVINQAKMILPSNSLNTFKNITESTLTSNKNIIFDTAKFLYQKDSTVAIGIKLLEIATDLNITEAFVLFGNAYKNGRGVKKNIAMAALNFKIAADLGEKSSMFEYASILMNFFRKTISVDDRKKMLKEARNIINNQNGKNKYYYIESRLCFVTIENSDASIFAAIKYFEKVSDQKSSDELKKIRNTNQANYPLPYFDELCQKITK